MPAPDERDRSLAVAVDRALAASTERTVLVEHGAQRYVAKRLADRARSRVQALGVRWLVKRVMGLSLPMRTLLLSDPANSVDYEAQRLEALALAGVPVPRVELRRPGYLLLEHCGPTVAGLLDGWSSATWREELTRLADDLAAFHRGGQWHGAAQIKNLTRKGSITYRIDFEEDFGDLVPLPAAQALDLVLFINSISLAGPIDEAESIRLLPELVRVYLAGNPDPAVRSAIVNALPWLGRLARLTAPLRGGKTSEGRPRKGLARLALLSAALASALAPQ